MKKNKLKKKLIAMTTTLSIAIMTSQVVHAEPQAGSNTSSIDAFVKFICDWLLKIGSVIALVGGVMFAIGWLRDDAESKSRGLMTIMGGFMVVAIAKTPDIFGL